MLRRRKDFTLNASTSEVKDTQPLARSLTMLLMVGLGIGISMPLLILAQQPQDLKSLVQQAFDFHQRGEFTQALPLLRRAHTLDPNDYFVNLLLGIDTLRTGDSPAAIPFLKQASRLRTKEEYPLDYLGEAYARQEMYGEAAEAYIRAVHVVNGSAESSVAFVDFALSRFATMSALLRSSKKGLAAEYRLRALALSNSDGSRMVLLQRTADLDPSAPGIWSDLARAALLGGETSIAESDLRQALQADPNDLVARMVGAQLAAEVNDWPRAFQSLNFVAQHSPLMLARAVSQWPQKLQPPSGSPASAAAARFFYCVREASAACDLGPRARVPSEDSAILFREQKWEQLSSLPRPHQTKDWLERGVAFAHLEDCPQAIPALERGLTKSDPDIYGMFLLSWCYSREAGRTADQVQQAGSDDAPLHVMRGDVLLRVQAKADMAASEYQQALARTPNDPSILERLAEAQFGAGQIDAARQDAESALKIDSQRLGARRTLAKIAMQRRDYAAALPDLRELVARDPQDVTMRIELAKACAQTGAVEEAWKNLAPTLDHGYPDEKGSLHYLLGTILKKMGRAAEAEQAFATASQLSEAFQQKSYRDQDPDAQPQ
jgi:tetratricopeptide (TPR) repeat protein